MALDTKLHICRCYYYFLNPIHCTCLLCARIYQSTASRSRGIYSCAQQTRTINMKLTKTYAIRFAMLADTWNIINLTCLYQLYKYYLKIFFLLIILVLCLGCVVAMGIMLGFPPFASNLGIRSRSECLTCTFRASCCSARLSRAQVPTFAVSSVRDMT